MISTSKKCLVILGLALFSACDDNDDGLVGSADGGLSDTLAAGLDAAPTDTGFAIDANLANLPKDAALAAGGSGGVPPGGSGGASQSGSLLTTSVPGGRQADKLTPAELMQVCKDLSVGIDAINKRLEPKICNVAGAIAYAVGDQKQATCENAVNECLAEPSEPTENACEALTNCTATLTEVFTCMNDQIKDTEALFNKFPTCAQLAGGASFPEGLDEQPMPASCKAIEAKCPSVALSEM